MVHVGHQDCLFVFLQDSYWTVLHDEIIEVISSRQLSEPSSNAYRFQMFNFTTSHQVVGEQHCSYVLALCHAVWQHASIGQLSVLPGWALEFHLCPSYAACNYQKAISFRCGIFTYTDSCARDWDHWSKLNVSFSSWAIYWVLSFSDSRLREQGVCST